MTATLGATSAGSSHVFVTGLSSPSLALMWTSQLGATGADAGYGVAVSSGRVFTVGSVIGAAPGGTSLGGTDAYLAALVC